MRPNFSRVRLKKTLVALVRPAIREKKKVSLLFDNRHVSLMSWSKPIRDSEGRTPPRLAVVQIFLYVCVCAFEDACAAAVRQKEREVSNVSRVLCSSFSDSALFSECLTVPPGFCDR